MSTKPTFVVREKNHPNACSCRQTVLVPTQQIASSSGTRIIYNAYVYQHVQYYIHVHGCTTIECSTYVRSRTISVAAIENTPSLNAVQQINTINPHSGFISGGQGVLLPPPLHLPPWRVAFPISYVGLKPLDLNLPLLENFLLYMHLPLLSQ